MDIWTALNSVPAPILLFILVVLVIVTVYIVIENARMKGLEGIRAEIYQYMLKAEHMFKSGEGRQKLKYVVGKARGLLPGWLLFFISEDFLMELIDMWFTQVKDLLDDGKINNSENQDVAEE